MSPRVHFFALHKKYDNVWPMLRAKSSNSSKSMHFKIIKFGMEYYCFSAWAMGTYRINVRVRVRA